MLGREDFSVELTSVVIEAVAATVNSLEVPQHDEAETVQNNDENNVFANERRHSEQPESINDTYVLEKDDSNVTHDSSNICNNDNQVDQNAAEFVNQKHDELVKKSLLTKSQFEGQLKEKSKVILDLKVKEEKGSSATNGFHKDELHQMVSAENNTSGPVPQCSNDVCSHQFRHRSSSKWRLFKITLQAPFLNVQMTSVHISSGLVLHQMTSGHNRSELGILVHSNEPSSSKLIPKVVPLAVKIATSRQVLGFYYSTITLAMLRK
ncbi:hypothetical protein Tco_0606178 [Tanacetum coccineum]